MLKSKSVSGPWAHLYSQFHVHTIWKAVEQGFPYWRMSSSPFRAWDASEGVEGVSKHLFSLPVVLYLACLLRTTKDGQKATLLQLNPEDPALLNRHWFLQAVNLLTCAKISPCFSETPNDLGNQRGKEATFNNTFPLQATENQKEILEARQNCHILFGAISLVRGSCTFPRLLREHAGKFLHPLHSCWCSRLYTTEDYPD